MRSTRPALSRLFFWIAGLTAGLWALHLLLHNDAVLAQSWSDRVFNGLAAMMTAILVVMAGAELALSRALRGAEAEPTAFMRILVYGGMAFAASFLTLRYLGFELREVFATSAIVTAAVGFAMQPTLASMFSGLALHIDHVIRVGDGIWYDGQWVEVTSLGWRSITGLTTSGRRVVVPNARISEQVTQVAPADHPIQAQFQFLAGIEIRPEILFDLVTEMMIALPLVEEALSVSVSPVNYQPHARAARYQVKYWIRSYGKAEEVLIEAHRRLWYVFQRNGIAYPGSGFSRYDEVTLKGLAPDEVDRLIGRVLAIGLDSAARLREAGDVLLYAAGEYLIAPPRTEGSAFLMLHGEAEPSVVFESPEHLEHSAPLYKLSRGAAVHRIARELAVYIGPYAEFAVSQAARHGADLMALCRTVAAEIADPNDQRKFLDTLCPEMPTHIGPGDWLGAHRNAAGALVCGSGLRARHETALLAVPRALYLDYSKPRAEIA